MSLADHDAQFRSQLLSLYRDRTVTEESFVNQLANIINEHISSALVKISPAQTVSVLPPSPPGAYSSVLAAGPYPVTGNITTPSEGFEITGGLE